MPDFTSFVRIDLGKFLLKYGVLNHFGLVVTENFLENLFLKITGYSKDVVSDTDRLLDIINSSEPISE